MNPARNEKIDQIFDAIYKEAEKRQNEFRDDPVPKVHIGLATCGIASGALETKKAFEEALDEYNIDARIHTVGCLGHCYAEPVVVIDHPGSGFPPIFYHEVNAGKAKMLAKLFLKEGDPRFEHVYGAMEENDLIPSVMEFTRFNREKRVVMEKCGHIDPEDIYDYIAEGGYSSLAKVLKLNSDEIVKEVQHSGLRGRGGAGFPTGRKWELAKHTGEQEKIVICNADEGDPGAYMDRTILESNPHQVIEGMAICAYAVGAKKAIIYVRAEYPLAVKIVTKAIRQATEIGLLGESVLGSSFDLKIDVFRGSGAFVCGEETALIRSIEGYRGMPRHRPPYPVQKGLWNTPTVINNVKTLASVPPILDHGADWYREIGTENSPGTAIFSVVGNVVHAGLVEIPMGVSLRTLIFDICGGIPNNKKFKAVQIGGPSGGCLNEDFLDTPIDFDSLTEAGAMMGSGGMVVMDEDTCMVEVSRYFLDFTQNESCGKCTFCRIGTKRMLEILDRITMGEGKEGDIELLEELAYKIKNSSLCGLGQTAPNPVLTTIKYFRSEYEAHINEKRCPAHSCTALLTYKISTDKCTGCTLCAKKCPVNAISGKVKEVHLIDP
ncbi:MAG: NADH-ubiquinone oxidoreductase-F iron-sulfur binding region domain-containing protein, partial [Desulfobacterales bacterium]